MPTRNDANDDFDDVPSLRMRADIPDDDDFLSNRQPHVQARPASVAAAKVKAPTTGPLWALVGALLCALAFLAWWSFQQISMMEQQLVATQESFARISEDAAGRLQDISGKVVAGQSNVMSDSEALKLQIKQLENKLQEQNRQFEGKLQEQYKALQGAFGPSADLDTQLAKMIAQASQQENTNTQLQASNKELQAQVKALAAEVSALKNQGEGGALDAQLKSIGADITALKRATSNSAIDRLEQDMVVLKSQQENRSGNTAEFDAFRGQVTRNINTLQSQIQYLQQQLSNRSQ
ncbi:MULTISPECIES: ATPase [Pseudomonas]|jgi:chromosome segregation ATPase|uniref:ATPase n=1 Tax=Pseudomonas frederiksbergensis TaxID=104087 RepID=A0A0B1YYZ2_9PSED|nr:MULTISPECIES: ATPase [Pseudomonas]KHK62183.1 ATPase [Pseudomonas frederiksbergensis]KJH87490.1 ATPase [Pseudomonas fluorescens]MBI6621737.1 ATPase [Pseudomonas corrugata]MBI6692372.1 ATPase [Pseudomonas corrugata]WRV67146.1 ATPase [Pseudomonas frederiksbergensis]